LPLLGADKAGRRQHRQDLFGAAGTAKQIYPAAVGWNTFPAFTGEDQCAARLNDPRPALIPLTP